MAGGEPAPTTWGPALLPVLLSSPFPCWEWSRRWDFCCCHLPAPLPVPAQPARAPRASLGPGVLDLLAALLPTSGMRGIHAGHVPCPGLQPHPSGLGAGPAGSGRVLVWERRAPER